MDSEFSSPLLENAVTALSRLPGVGRKTALRFALHLLRRPADEASALADAVRALRQDIRYCSVCHNISDTDICPICSDPRRRSDTVCVVESVKDVMIVENTRQYDGIYHVLGGLISPVDGIGPDALEIESLLRRAESGDITEVIFATGTTVEADTTNFYIYRLLSRRAPDVRITQLARGVAVGNELQYTDEATLARSIAGRTPFEI